MSGCAELQTSLQDGVATITLNRPRALNALTLEMMKAMTATLTAWEADSEVKVIVVVGAGDRAFCSGGDVKSIAAARYQPLQREFLQCEYRLDLLISNLATPFISVWSGLVMGGGVGISRMGQVRLATEKTVLAMPECGIGLIPDVGASHFLPLLPGSLGLFLGLTGHRVGGWECRKFGLASHYVRSEDVPLILEEVTRHASDPTQLNSILATFEQSQPLENKPEILSGNLKEINVIFSLGTLPEIIQKLKSSSSDFSRETVDMLEKCSPTSLSIAFHQLRRGAASYKEALQLEYRWSCTVVGQADLCKFSCRLMTRRFLDPDFYEGVRAALIDKDHKPAWSKAEAQIEKYFERMEEEEELLL